MRRIQLSDGAYVNPADVSRIEIEKHFLRKKYSVRLYTRQNAKIGAIANLDLPQAKSEKRRLQRELEELHTEISAYDEGYKAGSKKGTKSGYAKGHDEGYRQGLAIGHEAGRQVGYKSGFGTGWGEGYETGLNEGIGQGQSAGRAEVLDQLGHERNTLIDEISYGTRLSETRRQSIFAVINLIDGVTASFLPPEPEPEQEADANYTDDNDGLEAAVNSGDVRLVELPFNKELAAQS